jgi:hypothetical protein
MRVLPVSAAVGSGPEAVGETVLAEVEAAAEVVVAAVAEVERLTVAAVGAAVWAPLGYTTEAGARVGLQNRSGRRRGTCRRRHPLQ